MDEATRASGPTLDDEQNGRSPEQIRADIEETRHELGDTVEELAAKTDVKAHAQAKADELKGKVAERRVPIAAVGVAAAVLIGIVLIRR